MKQEPLVSVLMNCYNGEKYLEEAVNSVLAQTYQNWEIIFWDNQSTDRSADVFKSFEDPRLKYFYAPKHTLLYEARNCALEKASGDFIAFLDVDDWWVPSKLEKQVSLFTDHEVGIVCSNYWSKSEKKNKVWKRHKQVMPTGWVLNNLLKFYFVGLLTLMIRRAALESLEYAFDGRYHIIGDFDLVVRLATHCKLNYVDEPLAFYRLHDSNESSKHYGRQISEHECWIDDMVNIEAIRSCTNFHFIRIKIIYLKAKQFYRQIKRSLIS